MKYINAIFENEDITSLIENNAELVDAISESVDIFGDYLKEFIAENAAEFIEPTVEETRKNIRVFSEVAIAQYIKEQTSMYGNDVADKHIQQLTENSVNSYI